MKIFIPFNSNDFNSIFSTLTISPREFYPERGYSFKRATPTILNPFEEYLIAFEKPTFSQRDLDEENGYVINLEVEFPEHKLQPVLLKFDQNIKCFALKETIYLKEDFKLIFRRRQEKLETEAKTLKSIETKFTTLAKNNSTLSDSYDVSFIKNKIEEKDISIEGSFSKIDLKREEVFNKIFGALLGFAVGSKNKLSPEISRIKNLLRELNNLSSLFFNKIGEKDANRTKERLIACIGDIEGYFNERESLEQALIMSSNSEVSTELIMKLKDAKICEHSLFDLLIEGLLSDSYSTSSLPFHLIIEKAKRRINSRYNSKYPDKYVQNISDSISEIISETNLIVDSETTSNNLINEDLLQYNEMNFSVPHDKNSQESEYLKLILIFFTRLRFLTTTDDLFSNRKDIIKGLGKELSAKIVKFKGDNPSPEYYYLLDLLKSFDSLRSSFDPLKTDYVVFQSLAVLFTSGRDLQKYLDGISKINIDSLTTPLAIWGAVYGYASLPKTLTEKVLTKEVDYKELIKLFRISHDNYLKASEPDTVEEQKHEYILYDKKIDAENAIQEKVIEEKSDFFNKILTATKYGKNQGLEDVLVKFEHRQRMFPDSEMNKKFLEKFLNKKENKISGIAKKGIEEIVNQYEQYLQSN